MLLLMMMLLQLPPLLLMLSLLVMLRQPVSKEMEMVLQGQQPLRTAPACSC